MRKAYMIGSKTAADKNYFCVTPVNGSAQVGWHASYYEGSEFAPPPSISLEYSFNRTQWTSYTLGTDITITGPVYFRGDNSSFVAYGGVHRITQLKLTALCDLSGRINSLSKKIVYDASPTPMPIIGRSYSSFKLFSDNTYIRSVKDLILNWDAPLTDTGYLEVSGKAYGALFSGCTSLIDTPIFVGAIGHHGCYRMFYGCTSLTTIYSLPAPTIEGQYASAFAGCTSLQTAPDLHSTLTTRCYAFMFYDCTSLTQVPSLPATTLAANCYQGMFANCASLTQVPSLPAVTLAENCYEQMFYGCTGLTVLPDMSNDNLPSQCYKGMFAGIRPNEEGMLHWHQTDAYPYEFIINATTAAADATDGLFTGSSPEINTTYYCRLPTAQSQR